MPNIRTPNIPIRKPNIPINKPNIPIRKPNIPIRKTNFPVRKTNFPVRKTNILKTNFPVHKTNILKTNIPVHKTNILKTNILKKHFPKINIPKISNNDLLKVPKDKSFFKGKNGNLFGKLREAIQKGVSWLKKNNLWEPLVGLAKSLGQQYGNELWQKVLPDEVCGSVVDFALDSVLKTEDEEQTDDEEEQN